MRTTSSTAALLVALSLSTHTLSASTTFEFEHQAAGAVQPKPQDPVTAPPKAPTAGAAQAPGQPQPQTPAQAATTFKPEQIEQIVAPIALHPDSLLAQILMASTYPLEIVEAYRWLEKNPGLKGPALEEALKKTDWDPSVKALCGFREVVKMLNDNLDWTQDLGDAFLGQKTEVMETVQKMRQKALEAGNLKTNEQQKVTQEDKVVIIETTSTEVVYVPTYSPTVVYGPSWYYPYYYYPPMYVAPRPGYGFVAFGVGVAWGAAVWGGCNWHGNDVNINVNNFNNFNRNTNINGGRDSLPGAGNSKWNHDASHRKGVNYKDPGTAQKFGGGQGQNRVTKDQARGFDRSAAQGRPSAGTSDRGGGAAPRASTQPAGGAQRPAAAKPATKTGGGSALSGSRSAGADRSASSRGATSRASSGGGARAGGARSGGGGRGGGGGRR